MVELYGQLITREQLLARVGDVSQVGGVRLGELGDGPQRGERIADVRTGSGLAFTVHVDHGLDIGAMEYCGEPLAWRPGYEPARAPGGALATCSLDAPSPCPPAQNVQAGGTWEDNEYEMFVAGRMRQGSASGDRVERVRRISARLGESYLTVRDQVTNNGATAVPYEIAYRCGVGYPVLDDEAELLSPSRQVVPAGEPSRRQLAGYDRFGRPEPGYAEQVYCHDMLADGDGLVRVALVNHRASVGRGLGVFLRYRKRELPYFVEWKLLGQGDYVVSLAPANALPEGCAAAGSHHGTELLAPGEMREYVLQIGALPDNGAIERLEQDMRRVHKEWVSRREV